MRYKLGLNHKPTPEAVPHFSRVMRLMAGATAAPDSCDWHAAALPTFDLLLNDRLSCCVPVAAFESERIAERNAWDSEWRPSACDIITYYMRWADYDPSKDRADGSNPTDNGTDTDRAMLSWCSEGILTNPEAGTLIVPIWTQIPVDRLDLLRLAIALTGPVQISLALPEAYQDERMRWDVPLDPSSPAYEPGSWGYHRVCSGKYNAQGIALRTWGTDVLMSWAALARYAVAFDATLRRSWMDASGKSPSHLDWDSLRADMALLA